MYLTESMKHSVIGLGGSLRVLFSFEPVLRGLGSSRSTVRMLKSLWAGLAGFKTRRWGEGRARLQVHVQEGGKKSIYCGRAGLSVESVHLWTEKQVFLRRTLV